MSSEDSNIKQLELRISLPVKFTAEVDEYRKKMKDMVENYAILSQDENLSEGAIQREALKLFNDFREERYAILTVLCWNLPSSYCSTPIMKY